MADEFERHKKIISHILQPAGRHSFTAPVMAET